MANYADVKVHIQAGTGQGGSSPPPTSNGWVRAKSQDGNGNWTVDSEYWFYYSGGNGNGSGNGGTAGGEVDIPAADGGTFTVGPSGNEVINSISFIETQTPRQLHPTTLRAVRLAASSQFQIEPMKTRQVILMRLMCLPARTTRPELLY